MNPLYKMEDNKNKKLISKKLQEKIKKKMKVVKEGIKLIETTTGIRYPKYYIEPSLTLSESRAEFGEIAILYSRTIPFRVDNQIEIRIELTAALISLGLKTTIIGVLAHEFMHYVELIRRFSRLDITREISTTITESLYIDQEELYDAKKLFNDKKLIKIIEKKFRDGLSDNKLNKTTIKNWIEKKMPQRTIRPEQNIVRIPISTIMNSKFDPKVLSKLDKLENEEKNKKKQETLEEFI